MAVATDLPLNPPSGSDSARDVRSSENEWRPDFNKENQEPDLNILKELKPELQLYRDLLTAWAKQEKEKCDKLYDQHQTALIQAQREIHKTSQELETFPTTFSNDAIDESESIPLRQMESSLSDLELMLKQEQDRLKAFQVEAAHEHERSQQSQTLLQQAKSQAESVLYHLQKASRAYSEHVGLDFQKAGSGSAVRFIWTQLDPKDPDRPFSFVLDVSEHSDLYHIQECSSQNPAVQQASQRAVNNLNRTLDMAAFIREMRKVFLIHELKLLPDQPQNNDYGNQHKPILETPMRQHQESVEDDDDDANKESL